MKEGKIVCYETDASRLFGKARRVIFPESVKSIQEAIKTGDVVPRGGGSSLMGGCIPENSIVIDMKKMNHVLNLNPKNQTVEVEAGVTIKELNEKLNAVGFEFPVYANTISTIGGMIALNTIGIFSGYKSIKEWTEGIEFVNGRGELIKIGRADVSDVCGLEGSTGVIVKVKLKIVPFIKRSASIFQTDSVEELWVFTKRLKLEKNIAMLRVYSPEVSKSLGLPERYNLIIVFNSTKGKIKYDEYDKLIKLVMSDYFHLYKNEYVSYEDPQFLYDKLGEFMIFLSEIKLPFFCDLISGIAFPFFKENDERVELLKKEIYKMAGKPGKYGIGLKRKELLDVLEKKIIKRVKLRYDPFSKINRDKVLDFDFVSKPDVDINEEIKKPRKDLYLELSGEQDFEKTKIETTPLSFDRPEDLMKSFLDQVDIQEDREISETLKDYEQTFSSEFSENKKFVIEEFAKALPREIAKKEIKLDKDIIPDLDSESGKVVLTDNLDLLPNEVNKSSDKKNIGKNEQSLIDSIMTNKFKEKNNGS
jgi:hypothetical protein